MAYAASNTQVRHNRAIGGRRNRLRRS
jgi:hypothetical protein